jgi:hypothetical protein
MVGFITCGTCHLILRSSTVDTALPLNVALWLDQVWHADVCALECLEKDFNLDCQLALQLISAEIYWVQIEKEVELDFRIRARYI